MSKESKRALVASRLAAGLCRDCGKGPHRPGAATCDACALRIKEYNRKKIEECKRRSLCVCCHKPNPRAPMTLCPECRSRHRATVASRKDVYNARRRVFQATHRDRLNRDSRDERRALRERVMAGYGNRCRCCGESRYEFLTFDHVNNDGAAHRRALFGSNRRASSTKLVRMLEREGFPDYMQILCWNCNQAKAFHGICPHRRDQGAGDGLSSNPAPR